MFAARGPVGNHAILDPGDGVYALYAHLRRGLSSVRMGERCGRVRGVRAMDVPGRCGNATTDCRRHRPAPDFTMDP